MTQDEFIEAFSKSPWETTKAGLVYKLFDSLRAELAAMKEANRDENFVFEEGVRAGQRKEREARSQVPSCDPLNPVGYKTSPADADPVCECGHKESCHDGGSDTQCFHCSCEHFRRGNLLNCTRAQGEYVTMADWDKQNAQPVGDKTTPVEADPVCKCGHKASEHSETSKGCLHMPVVNGGYCQCWIPRSEVRAAASGQAGERRERYGRAIALLDKWAEENDGFDARVEPLLVEAMEKIRAEQGRAPLQGEPAPQPASVRAPGESSETDAIQPAPARAQAGDDELVRRGDIVAGFMAAPSRYSSAWPGVSAIVNAIPAAQPRGNVEAVRKLVAEWRKRYTKTSLADGIAAVFANEIESALAQPAKVEAVPAWWREALEELKETYDFERSKGIVEDCIQTLAALPQPPDPAQLRADGVREEREAICKRVECIMDLYGAGHTTMQDTVLNAIRNPAPESATP